MYFGNMLERLSILACPGETSVFNLRKKEMVGREREVWDSYAAPAIHTQIRKGWMHNHWNWFSISRAAVHDHTGLWALFSLIVQSLTFCCCCLLNYMLFPEFSGVNYCLVLLLYCHAKNFVKTLIIAKVRTIRVTPVKSGYILCSCLNPNWP